MCRFLLVQSNTNVIQPQVLLEEFARMAEKSKAYDGDWQGDGWGVAWIDEKKEWHSHKSLLPIWKDTKKFGSIPSTTTLVIHARSASFPQHKGVLDFNQPYIEGKYAFVFNGLLKGVSLPGIPGKIGAEKIWYLVKKELNSKPPQEALNTVKQMLINNSREVMALNMGVATAAEIYSINYFTQHTAYYQLHYYNSKDIKGVCSESIDWSVCG